MLAANGARVVRATIFIPLALIFATLVTSCDPAGQSGRDGKSIYIHINSEPSNLNPIVSNEGVVSTINNYIYESLVDRDYDTLELVPQLAERWEISPDRMRFRFYLKKGVRWHDGVEFTADDIVYSFKTLKDPKVACAHLKVYYIDVRSVVKLDRYTVEFTYSRPYFLGLEMCGEIPIVPEHIFGRGGDFNTHRNNRHPVGTGPYRFDRWETGKRIILVRNESYRARKPEIRRMVFRIVTEDNVALQMLKKGDLDVMGLRPIQWKKQTASARFNRNFYKFMYFLPNYSFIGWNQERAFFRDKRVRRAMTHFINRKDILRKMQFGLGKVVSGTFYVNSKAYSPEIEPWPFDPAEGKRLLAEAGWKDTDGDGILDKDGQKFKFTFTIASGSKTAERLTSILKEDLSKVGIDMNIERYEWAVFVDRLNKHNFDAVTLSWSLGYSGDPYQLWHSSQVAAGSNFCSFKNARADAIIESARVNFDEGSRNVLYHEFNRILHDEQPYTFLFCNPSLVAVSRRFSNVKVHTRGMNYLEWKFSQK